MIKMDASRYLQFARFKILEKKKNGPHPHECTSCFVPNFGLNSAKSHYTCFGRIILFRLDLLIPIVSTGIQLLCFKTILHKVGSYKPLLLKMIYPRITKIETGNCTCSQPARGRVDFSRRFLQPPAGS